MVLNGLQLVTKLMKGKASLEELGEGVTPTALQIDENKELRIATITDNEGKKWLGIGLQADMIKNIIPLDEKSHYFKFTKKAFLINYLGLPSEFAVITKTEVIGNFYYILIREMK